MDPSVSISEPAAAAPGEGLVDACFDPAAYAQMQRMLTDLKQVYHERKKALDEVTRAHHEALFLLALAAEYRDDDTGAHMVRMGFIAEALAQQIGMVPSLAAMVRMAAPMHDVGKIGVADSALKKAGPFNAGDRQEMNRHPELGASILGASRVPLFKLAAEIALSHHERWDGGGYPQGLAGDAIPQAGRIAAIADFFDALTMDRCYRRAFSDERALQMLQAERGRAFDPALVDAFVVAAPRIVALRDRINAIEPRPSFADLVGGLAPDIGR